VIPHTKKEEEEEEEEEEDIYKGIASSFIRFRTLLKLRSLVKIRASSV
jgi:hypothetical protein